MLACPNGRCGERIVLAGRNGLWYGRGRPEAFLCGGCGGRLTLAARIVLGRAAAAVEELRAGGGLRRGEGQDGRWRASKP